VARFERSHPDYNQYSFHSEQVKQSHLALSEFPGAVIQDSCFKAFLSLSLVMAQSAKMILISWKLHFDFDVNADADLFPISQWRILMINVSTSTMIAH